MKYLLIALLLILVVVTAAWLVKNNYHKPVIKVKQINQLGKKGKIPHALKNILEKRYRVVVSDKDYQIVIDDVFGNEDIKNIDNPNAIQIFDTAEAYLPKLDNYDLVIGFDRVNNPKYIRYPNYYNWYKDKIRVTEVPRVGQGECNPKKENFACFLVSNGDHDLIGYSGKTAEGTKARDSIFHRLSKYKWVASGGNHLNNIGQTVPRKHSKTQEWLSQCKFVISYENQYHNGYMTEKLFQAYFAGSIPIYWGDKTAVSDINKNAIIYADDFDSENELVEYVKTVDNDDELYCKIWNQHLITNPEMNYGVMQDKLNQKLFELIDTKLQK